MSVAYQACEISSTPNMGCNLAIQSARNLCSASDLHIPDLASSIRGFVGPSDPFLKDTSESGSSKDMTFSNRKVVAPQDLVMRDLSALSLGAHKGYDASDESRMISRAESTVLKPPTDFVKLDMQNKVSTLPGFTHSSGTDVQENCFRSSFPAQTVSKFTCREGGPQYKNVYGISYCSLQSRLDVVVEDMPLHGEPRTSSYDDVDLDSISSSSSSSHELLDEYALSGKGSHALGEEVQSDYRQDSFPQKKGLSKFYSGKSRSFSCLADVSSLRDLAKPENPYTKRRKCNVGQNLNVRAHLPPVQKGTASISKRLPCSGRSALALAIAMDTQDNLVNITDVNGKVMKICREGSSLTARSYSHSDLERVAISAPP
ncbi:hypothetical protein KP509_36G040300 [Ceratopteris richardii]|uniref:Uncharacterized protein n=1 Tax=Ceratopteris richardii TaxID=49495 RepID=A0A8T2QCH0_CERRI|nr:hypothetical protein KP509_36G040300 [Ceratopteris richardii]KAH7281311.1 hypothetical protein KP509_36G040300 [Ceratopteris richardii]KAH7281312.1 hypothetical protein KP509_36G040300 [Ceratopteris richardii]